ncbi:hypothetical protein [Aurantiacibacter spongiae]|uniref:hypothetical protein n=1 Tax=Aurantiacibacter spongiae TaxID=2488860 RepID=UPI0013152B2C|nr:hypothetical protein [Aurantiacibacter spongiae]
MTDRRGMVAEFFRYKEELQFAVLLVTALAAWRWGAGPERASIAVVLVVFGLGDAINHWLSHSGPRFTTIEEGHLLLDMVAFILFGAIALLANRVYPLCLTALQGLVLLIHFAVGLSTTAPLAYSILSLAPSYLLTLTLVAGMIAHWRRRRRYGPYRSWRRDFEVWLARRG